MSSYALGRSADIWADPEEFRPVRFCSDKLPSVCVSILWMDLVRTHATQASQMNRRHRMTKFLPH